MKKRDFESGEKSPKKRRKKSKFYKYQRDMLFQEIEYEQYFNKIKNISKGMF